MNPLFIIGIAVAGLAVWQESQSKTETPPPAKKKRAKKKAKPATPTLEQSLSNEVLEAIPDESSAGTEKVDVVDSGGDPAE